MASDRQAPGDSGMGCSSDRLDRPVNAVIIAPHPIAGEIAQRAVTLRANSLYDVGMAHVLPRFPPRQVPFTVTEVSGVASIVLAHDAGRHPGLASVRATAWITNVHALRSTLPMFPS